MCEPNVVKSEDIDITIHSPSRPWDIWNEGMLIGPSLCDCDTAPDNFHLGMGFNLWREVGEYLNKEHTDTDITISALLYGTFPDGLLVDGGDDDGDTGPSPPAQLPITPDPANKPFLMRGGGADTAVTWPHKTRGSVIQAIGLLWLEL